jgi:ribosomal protein S18 acetylase RimI-like enzyme
VKPFPATKRCSCHDAFIDELYIVPSPGNGVHAIHLEVDRGNDPALKLYRRTGYKDHDRLLMTKWLNRAIQ